MITYSEVKTTRVLNPTSIDLGEYVINPYKGCVYACLYCYVRSNKTSLCSPYSWGTYIEARINTGEQLEKEILLKKPRCVLLGSTTECFQPAEKKYGLTKKVLEILNRHEIQYVILTRSPLIREYVSLLKKGLCKTVYFTVSEFCGSLKDGLEKGSPSFKERSQAIVDLLKQGVSVVTYVCPVLPGATNIGRVFETFPDIERIDFEGLNFNLKNISEIIDRIGYVQPGLKETYLKMLADRAFYERIWQDVKLEILSLSRKKNKSCRIYIHPHGGYFNNKYVD